MFFNLKKDEVSAINRFKQTCTYHGLRLYISQTTLNALKSVVLAKNRKDDVILDERTTHILSRRGLVRITNTDEILITELGLLIIALAEAGELITLRGDKS